MEKPLGTVEVASRAMCGVKCSSLGENCGMFHYNGNTQDCTPAKVTELDVKLSIFRSL